MLGSGGSHADLGDERSVEIAPDPAIVCPEAQRGSFRSDRKEVVMRHMEIPSVGKNQAEWLERDSLVQSADVVCSHVRSIIRR